MSTTFRQRILEALKTKGWTARRASLEAGLSETALRDILANEDQSPRMSTIDSLAFALEVDPAWLAYGKTDDRPIQALGERSESDLLAQAATQSLRPASNGFTLARVDGFVQAGAFLQTEMFDDDPGAVISAPKDPQFPFARQIAYQVKGDSMDQLAPRPVRDGDYAICVAFSDTNLHPKTGMVVVVQQTRDGGQLRERSLKQIEMKSDRIEFHPRSSNPIHKPIIVPFDEDPNDGRQVEILSLLRFVFDNVPVQYI